MSVNLFLVLLLIVVAWKVFTLFLFPKILSRWFTLHNRQKAEDGFVAVADQSHLLGCEGTAATDLKPSGKASLKGDKLDVVSKAGFIPRGTAVKVVEVRCGTLFVEISSGMETP